MKEKLLNAFPKYDTKNRKFVYIFIDVLVVVLLLEIFYLNSLKREENEKNLDTWLGWYYFNSKFEENGTPFLGTNEIFIFKIDGDYYAEFICNGVPNPARLLGRLRGNKNSINIYYESVLPESGTQKEGGYEKGELLVTLSYEDSEIYTTWYALRQEFSMLLPEGLYYKKVSSYWEDDKQLGTSS